MRGLSNKESAILKYLILAVIAFSPIFLIFSLYFFLLPGWLLGRLIKIDYKDFSSKVTISFGLSLSLYLIINLLAIFLALNINQLIIIYNILIPILFIAAVVFDLSAAKNQPAI